MKICVMYICIGKYSVFFDEFYESAKKFFFTNELLDFYVFTDDENLISKYKDTSNLNLVYEKNLGWPYNTLYRFKMFISLGQQQLEEYDYVYFFNANALFIKPIDMQLIPSHGEIIVASHFKYFNSDDKYRYPYDRNKKSLAFVGWGHEGNDYIQACFLGATGKKFYEFSNLLAKNIEKDLNNDVIAIWHDESHFNKYIIDKDYTLLPYTFVYPESLALSGFPQIVMRNKENYATLTTLRGESDSLLNIILFKVKNTKQKLIIKFMKCINYKSK